ncbi:unnamed protein product [Linum trigynum]
MSMAAERIGKGERSSSPSAREIDSSRPVTKRRWYARSGDGGDTLGREMAGMRIVRCDEDGRNRRVLAGRVVSRDSE